MKKTNTASLAARCVALAALATLAASAAPAPDAGKAPPPDGERAARKAKMVQMMLRHTGGFVVRPGSQQGEVVYVNCQRRAPRAWIDDSIAYFAEETKFRVTYHEGTFDLAAPKVEGSATLFIVDDGGLPALLVAPESRWALVNVAAVARERRPAFFEARVRKQLSRGFAYLCGAANSQYPMCLTRGIVDEADLDRNADHRLPVDLFQRFRTYMEPLGVRPEVRTTYRQACKEGWAPAPTNEFQRAIWEKVHAVPDKPLTIEFDPKRDR